MRSFCKNDLEPSTPILLLKSVSVSPMYVSEVLLSFRVTVAW